MEGCTWHDGCNRSVGRIVRGYCHYHYKQAMTQGIISTIQKPSLQNRFFSKVDQHGGVPDYADPLVRISPELGRCWDWVGATQSQGYGRIKVDGTLEMATHVSLKLAGIDVPVGYDVDHLCRRPICVNPAHLEPVTRRENTLRGSIARLNHARRKDMCVCGRLKNGDNLIVYANGSSRCRACHNEANKQYMRRYRAAKKRAALRSGPL